MNFRDRLKDEISYSGFTIKELAAKTEISKRTLDTYVDNRGSIPAADVAVKLAKALNVSVEYLVTGEDSKLPDDIKESIKYKSLIQKLEKLTPENWEKLEPLFNAMIDSELKTQAKD